MIHISLRFALLLKDDFSGATIADGGQRFFVNGRPVRPIRKPEGFFVFTAESAPGPEPADGWEVRIESTRYFVRTLSVRSDQLPPDMPLRLVQMYRRPHSGFADCDWFEAKGPPGRLAALLFREDPPLALKAFSGNGEAISLRGYMAANLVWRRICVGSGSKAELFTLTARRPDGGYRVDHPARKRWKEGAPVYLTACAPAQPDGRCSVPIPPGWADRDPVVRWYDEEAMRWQEI